MWRTCRRREGDKGGREDQCDDEGCPHQGRRGWARTGASGHFTQEAGGGAEAQEALPLPQRVTCHSARKRAAIEAVLAGLPVPVVQTYGVWGNASSLEKHVGETLRQRFPFLRTLAAAARTGSHWGRHGETRIVVSSRDYNTNKNPGFGLSVIG